MSLAALLSYPVYHLLNIIYFTDHVYHSRAEYLADMELIASNCEQYNGSEAQYTNYAKKMVEFAYTQLEEVSGLTEYWRYQLIPLLVFPVCRPLRAVGGEYIEDPGACPSQCTRV